MSIFRTINASFDKPSFTIQINNMDCASDHFGSEKDIFNGLSSLETLLYDQDTLNQNLVKFALNILNHNPRIENIRCYRVPTENKLVFLAISDVSKFKEMEMFKREMSIDFKKLGQKFSVVEVIKKEFAAWEKDGKTIPDGWQLDEYLTNRIAKLKEYL